MSIVELSRRESLAQSIYYKRSKEFLKASKKRLAGDTVLEASSDDVKGLRKQAAQLKEVVAEQTLELRLLERSMFGDGKDCPSSGYLRQRAF